MTMTKQPPKTFNPGRCLSHKLDDIRRAADLTEARSIALARHLALPCGECHRALARLPPLDNATLLVTTNPVILALRTLGGHPHLGALDVTRMEALASWFREPLGFAWLVVEEARALKGVDSVDLLERCFVALEEFEGLHAENLRSLRMRTALYRVDALQRRGDLDEAHQDLDSLREQLETEGGSPQELALLWAIGARLEAQRAEAEKERFAVVSQRYHQALEALKDPQGLVEGMALAVQIRMEQAVYQAQNADLVAAWNGLRMAESYVSELLRAYGRSYPILEAELAYHLSRIAWQRSIEKIETLEGFCYFAWALGYYSHVRAWAKF